MEVYTGLIDAINDKGIRKTAIAKRLNICPRTLTNKINGVTAFTWPEICVLHETFFPEKDKETLFATRTDK